MDAFVGEIRIVGFNFAPNGWAFCDGQILSISQNTALFSLLGTNFGGDGRQTFALPDLRGKIGVNVGQGDGLSLYTLGQNGGESTHVLTVAEMPAHQHTVRASNTSATTGSPQNLVYAKASLNGAPANLYRLPNNDVGATAAMAITGGDVPHENMQAGLVMNFIIALQGIFPPRP